MKNLLSTYICIQKFVVKINNTILFAIKFSLKSYMLVYSWSLSKIKLPRPYFQTFTKRCLILSLNFPRKFLFLQTVDWNILLYFFPAKFKWWFINVQIEFSKYLQTKQLLLDGVRDIWGKSNTYIRMTRRDSHKMVVNGDACRVEK